MEIADQLKIVANHHRQLVLRYHELGTAIARLTAAGCIDAKEYWKDGKYLYLLYPMRNGLRKKKYVGNHPLRIEEARTKLANYRKRFDLIVTQRMVEHELAEIESLVNNLLRICSKSDLSARFAIAEQEALGTAGSRSPADFVPMPALGTPAAPRGSESVPKAKH